MRGRAILILVALMAAPTASAAPARQLAADERQFITDTVGDGLRDPDSARFKWSLIDTDALTYCGEVNAKNGYGGYAGFRLFSIQFITGDDGKLLFFSPAFPETPSAIAVARAMCGIE